MDTKYSDELADIPNNRLGLDAWISGVYESNTKFYASPGSWHMDRSLAEIQNIDYYAGFEPYSGITVSLANAKWQDKNRPCALS